MSRPVTELVLKNASISWIFVLPENTYTSDIPKSINADEIEPIMKYFNAASRDAGFFFSKPPDVRDMLASSNPTNRREDHSLKPPPSCRPWQGG